MPAHRPLPADSELARAITVLARAQQDAAWNRGQLSSQLRSHLKQYFPAALAAFQVKGIGLCSRQVRAVLAVAPDPAAAARLSAARLGSVLRKAGRQRSIEAWVRRLATAFAEHPDAAILSSFPGIGPVTGARVLAEIGDDRARFRDARGLKSYAGSAPVTVASGKSRIVRNRKVKNQRLAAAGYVWIFGALPSPEVKNLYDRRRAAGDRHAAAMRNVFNRLLGCLHHCLQTGQAFDPAKVFPLPESHPEPAAA
jgi:transposase